MKNFFKIGFTAAFLLAVFAGFSATDARAQGEINKILNKMDAHYKSLQALKSEVTMEKYNPQIKRSEVSKGNVTYVPESKKRKLAFRLDWTSPAVEYLTVRDGKYYLYKPGVKQVITGKVDKAKNNAAASGPLAFLSMSKQQLRANYNPPKLISASEKVNGTIDAAHIELTPKTASNYKKVDLWIDANGMPVQAQVLEKSGDITTVLLYNFQKNMSINFDIFKLDYPKGTEVIEG